MLKKREEVEHLHFPIYSNTADTIYFVVGEDDSSKIAVIGIYKNHRLVESIDLKDLRGPHWHKWSTKETRKGEAQVKVQEDFFNLKASHRALIKYAHDWENGA